MLKGLFWLVLLICLLGGWTWVLAGFLLVVIVVNFAVKPFFRPTNLRASRRSKD